MGSLSLVHWVILLVVVVLIFGTKRIGTVGKDLGSAVRGFRDGMKDGDVTPMSILAKEKESAGVHVFDNEALRDKH